MQLNPFEIKAEISRILSVLTDVKDFENYLAHYHILDVQQDKNVIMKLLLREINNSRNPDLIKFLLLRYSDKKGLVAELWNIVKNNLSSNSVKIFALDLLRELDSDWTYEECDKYVDNPSELIDADTKKILDGALISPEIQIDFLDFLNSLSEDDKFTLLNSLSNDYSKDELANIVIPVFLSNPYSKIGKAALDILGNSKSQLAYHALNYAMDSFNEDLHPSIKKNLSILKLAGIREDNSKEFYKNLLRTSKPYKFFITYPDGHGNSAVIYSRVKETSRVQFVAVVINDYDGIRDCFGFNDISKFECDTIIERFYRGQSVLELSPEVINSILSEYEKLSKNTVPYEYICWKNILADIEKVDLNIHYDTKELSAKEFEDILKSDFTDYWFLDEKYSDEVEEFLKLVDSTNPENFDEIIELNLKKIFFKAEYDVWRKRILNVAKLKHFSGDIESAQNLYSVYNNEKYYDDLLKNIVRKSIYEYCFAHQQTEKVKTIEEMWVS